MTTSILITGFGPFPGAPFNPTEPLVLELARRRYPAPAGTRRIAHVFHVSYEAVDRELPPLLARERPDALIMFGLATRSDHVRIETRARNALTRLVSDADGAFPAAASIVPGAPPILPLRAPVDRLLAAARQSGVTAALSHDAGRYLCNYLCWRAAEASRADGPRLAAFIHVPAVDRVPGLSRRYHLTFAELIATGEAIVRAAIVAARRPVLSGRD
jgi:pyroglutamyl-peptidase